MAMASMSTARVSSMAAVPTARNGAAYVFGLPTATVSGISPSQGSATGGGTVTISGANLGTAGAASVHFGNTPATILSDTGNQIVAVVPRGLAGAVDVAVTTQYGVSATSAADKFTYVAAPAVAGITPKSGSVKGGTPVTIQGTGLAAATAVYFGKTPAKILADSGTQIVATDPAGSAGMVDVTVVTAGGASAVSPLDRFTYIAAPMVTGLAPASGPVKGGTKVTITGTNLANPIEVLFGRIAATVSSSSATQIVVVSPAEAAGNVDVVVVTAGGTSVVTAKDRFTFSRTMATASLSLPLRPAESENVLAPTALGEGDSVWRRVIDAAILSLVDDRIT
jgi:hypothetical protein